MSQFNPQTIEAELRDFWENNGFYRAKKNPHQKPFVIMMPPPNVTADLHIGHMLNNTVQDYMIRTHRQKGDESLWVPGLDHASIATEARVTKMLAEQGVSKYQIGREGFLEHARQWKDKYGGRINLALRTLGISADWSREAYTMSPQYERSVLEAFCKLYNDGLVYRGRKLVNWCPFSQSVISDEEVQYEERQGTMFHIRYPLVSDPSRFVVVATTRPETLFGDQAVAVHPDDERYQSIIGQQVLLPIAGRSIPIIADAAIEPDFGTGCVKITPAHDPLDHEIGLRHGLELMNIMTPDAHLNQLVPEGYRGLERFEARKKLIQELESIGLLDKKEPYKNKVGISERGRVPIEYYLSDQWFIKMQPLAEKALDATRSGRLKLLPEHAEKTWEHWLTNIQDWCVSRQLWWGQRIPVYTCETCGHVVASPETPGACVKCQAKSRDQKWKQDADVLDTWASSWLWPMAALGWPDPEQMKLKEFDYFFPTDVIVTGADIIFFWIARMVMASEYFLGKTPFHHVVFTGLIRDSQGRKFSKSLGNSPDTFEIINEYGTDALRFSLLRQMINGQDVKWNKDVLDIGKHFANKIWNAGRFLELQREIIPMTPVSQLGTALDPPEGDALAVWICDEFDRAQRDVDASFSNYQFNDSAARAYDFVWFVYCDWMIEFTKARVQSDRFSDEQKQGALRLAYAIFERCLALLHPIMPYITERCWQDVFCAESTQSEPKSLGLQRVSHCLSAAWQASHETALMRSRAQVNVLQSFIRSTRNIRSQFQIHPRAELPAYAPELQDDLQAFLPEISKLVSTQVLFVAKPDQCIAGLGIADGRTFVLALDGHVEVDAEIARIDGRLKKLSVELAKAEKKLADPIFMARAKPEAIAEKRREFEELSAEKASLELSKSGLS